MNERSAAAIEAVVQRTEGATGRRSPAVNGKESPVMMGNEGEVEGMLRVASLPVYTALTNAGKGLMGPEQQRYFQVRGRFLRCYEKKPASPSEEPRGRIDMTGIVVSEDPKNPFGFTISGPLGPPICQFIVVGVGRERSHWVHALKAASEAPAAPEAQTQPTQTP
eukprot:Hpha_TRINITY_DN15851_c4_g2::TRINITY_DN15851_c4_g2_i1::g.191498::m.191498